MTVLNVPPLDPNGVIAATSGISHWSPWVFVSASGIGLVFLLADRILKPWHARRLAEAREREALALLMSEQMQDALKILVGERANPDQGIEERPGMGRRIAQLEALFRNGINAKIDENHAIIAEHIAAADQTRNDLVQRIESLAEDVAESRDAAADAARLAGDTAVVAARELQKISGRMDDFDEKVTERLFTLEESERTLRAIVHEVGFDVDIPTPPDPPPAAA